MKNADALKFSFFIKVIENVLVQDDKITLFPLAGGTWSRITQYVEFGNELDTKMAAPGNKDTYV